MKIINEGRLRSFLKRVYGKDYDFNACLDDLADKVAVHGDIDRGCYEVSRYEAITHQTEIINFLIDRDNEGTINKITF
ncbi:hypothetical protein [Sporolactobacillus putidus]|uniref:Uncharacterized protein n=1 Tax=Sporolactobacillus putidus TaxID=492735 RepID=A0A917S696_9BACL|nr:hypothetical protein [Sporolactobacillus putidus]GGL58089.1 hypothetical protein GCM10007968_22650 [Sporolactobacillus putidus]